MQRRCWHIFATHSSSTECERGACQRAARAPLRQRRRRPNGARGPLPAFPPALDRPHVPRSRRPRHGLRLHPESDGRPLCGRPARDAARSRAPDTRPPHHPIGHQGVPDGGGGGAPTSRGDARRASLRRVRARSAHPAGRGKARAGARSRRGRGRRVRRDRDRRARAARPRRGFRVYPAEAGNRDPRGRRSCALRGHAAARAGAALAAAARPARQLSLSRPAARGGSGERC